MADTLIKLIIGSAIYEFSSIFIYLMLFDYGYGFLKDRSNKWQNDVSLYVFISWFIICVSFSFKCIL